MIYVIDNYGPMPFKFHFIETLNYLSCAIWLSTNRWSALSMYFHKILS